MRRAPIVTLVQSAIDVTPTTFGQTGPKRPSSLEMIRRITNVTTTPTNSASIFHQKKGL